MQIVSAIAIGFTQAACADSQLHEQKPPNIILILIDDQGWTDLSTRMHPEVEGSTSDYYETPHIDQLAKESLVFSDGYSPSPICTPTRASLLTGKSPQQLGFTDIIDSKPGSRRFSDLYTGKKLIGPLPVTGLPAEEKTIAEFVKERVAVDYSTAHFGKWHLGGGGPGRHGFDVHDGSTGNNGVVANSEDPNPKDVYGLTGRAVAFMRTQVSANRPFFMQISHYANHVPLLAMNQTLEKYHAKQRGDRHSNPIYAAMNENLDSSIGSLMRAIDVLGIREQTYIVYTSDNGGSKNLKNPSTNNAPLREGKTWVFEGGVRVPFMVSGPGIVPGESSVPVIGWDFFPTFCEILGCEGNLPDGIEGGSLLPLLHGSSSVVDRPRGEALFWHFPHYLTIKGTTPQSAIRVGDHKLVKFYHSDESLLFDLSRDVGETTDIAAQHPDIVAVLEARLAEYLSAVGAGMPKVNEAYAK